MKRIYLVITALLIGLSPFWAYANSISASFDCSKAKRTLEILICADPQLSSLDGQVGMAFSDAKLAFTQDEIQKANLLNEQRDFLRKRMEICPIPIASDISETEASNITECLKKYYTERLNRLENSLGKINKNETENQQTIIEAEPTTKPTFSDKVSDFITRMTPIFLYVGVIVLLVWILYKVRKNRLDKPLGNRLINCKDCEKKFSPDALRCPNCGAKKPIKKLEKLVGLAVTGVSLIIIIAIVSIDSRTPEQKACAENWRQCQDNKAIMDAYWVYMSSACKREARNRARYGEPDFPSMAFSDYSPGRDYIETGQAFLTVKNVLYQNMYGTPVRVQVLCTYDLNKRAVDDIFVSE